jgi:hypothetical protein
MFRVDKVIKPWKDSAALNDHINLYGFWNKTVFITKSGDLGMVLQISGVDYESLDRTAQEYATKRLEAALKAFGPGFHVYQYLFKSNRPHIPLTIRLWRLPSSSAGSSLKQKEKIYTKSRASMPSCSRDRVPRPASGLLLLSFYETPPVRLVS